MQRQNFIGVEGALGVEEVNGVKAVKGVNRLWWLQDFKGVERVIGEKRAGLSRRSVGEELGKKVKGSTGCQEE